MHLHTTPTMAVCCLEDDLSPTNFYAAQLHGKVAHHDFEAITVHLDEGRRILASAAMSALRAIPKPVLAGCVRDSLNFDQRFGAGQDAIDAMQRLVDCRDPPYRA